MTIATLGIDLSKNSCSFVGLDGTGRVVLRRRMRREAVITFGARLPACGLAMEACGGAHHMGRALAKQWLRGLLARAHANTAVVALEAKIARIIWALLRHERLYERSTVRERPKDK